MERWRESLKEVQGLDLEDLLASLRTLGEEVDARFGQTGRMLEGKSPERTPQTLELALDKGAELGLSHFQKAALIAMYVSQEPNH